MSDQPRPVWLDKDDEQAVEWIYQRAKAEGDAATRAWAASIHARVDAAPADPAEAVSEAMLPIQHHTYDYTEETVAVLSALGFPDPEAGAE